MAVERLTVSLDPELAAAVRAAADEDEDALNMSAWLADAARRRLATRGLADVIADWEVLHGEFTPAELAAAQQLLSS